MSRMILYPQMDTKSSCGAMIVTNLADPAWITVGCNDPVTLDVMCNFHKATKLLNNSTFQKSATMFERSCIHKNNFCHIFIWSDFSVQRYKLQRKMFCDAKIFQFLYDAVSVIFPPIDLYPSGLVTIYTKLNSLYKYHITSSDKLFSQAPHKRLQVYIQHYFSFRRGENIHRWNKSYRSILFAYDCFEHNNQVQHRCICNETSNSLCNKTGCNHKPTTCSQLCVMLHDNQCSPVNWQSAHWSQISNSKGKNKKSGENAPGFLCNDGSILPAVLENDLVSDCGLEAEDESMVHSIVMGRSYSCPQNTQIPCREGFPVCYNISDICSYQYNVFGKLIHCRTGEHLQNCEEFECNMMYKCPKYYCIPWSYVCDSKWDCPEGFEEYTCKSRQSCEGMYKCEQSHICTHLNDVCNGLNDCPLQEDESLCSLSGMKCPLTCRCMMFAISCHKLDTNYFCSFSLPFHVVSVEQSKIQPLRMLLVHIKFFSALKIRNNNLQSLCDLLPSTKHAIIVDAGFNQIQTIGSGCFQDSQTITTIKLNNNNLFQVDNLAFGRLKSLTLLDLSHNNLSVLCGLSNGLEQIQVLFLQGNSIQMSTEDMQYSKLKYLRTDVLWICCLISNEVQCLAEKPWLFFCRDLLPDLAVKVSFYVESVVVIAFSSMSLLLRVHQRKTRISHSWAFGCSVISVNIVDITCGLYLTIIWVKDVISDNMFALYESEWKSSFLCFLAFAILLNFSFLSPLLLCFVSLQRLMVVLHPIDTVFKRAKFTIRGILVLSSFTFIMSSSIALTLRLLSLQVPFKLCSPFFAPGNCVVLIQVSTSVLTVLHLSAVPIICCVYGKLLKALIISAELLKGQMSKKYSNSAIILQLVAAIVTNILCWVPSSVMYLIFMLSVTYPMDMPIWTAAVVMPFNSVVNPVVFSVALKRSFNV